MPVLIHNFGLPSLFYAFQTAFLALRFSTVSEGIVSGLFLRNNLQHLKEPNPKDRLLALGNRQLAAANWPFTSHHAPIIVALREAP
jgi:hypothetical protein